MKQIKLQTILKGVLTNRNFMLLWLSQILSMLAINIMSFILISQIYDLTARSAAVSILILTNAVPALIFASVAGVFSDRYNRKKILIFANISRAVLALILAFLFKELPAIYIVSFLAAACSQFFMPAEAAAIPSLVKKEELLTANSLFMTTMYGSLVAGYALAGPLIIFLGDNNVLFMVSLMFGLATVSALLIISKKLIPEQAADNRKISFVTEIKEGWVLIKNRPDLLSPIVKLMVLWAMITMLVSVLPAYVKTVLEVPIENASYLLVAPVGVGVLIGLASITLLSKKFGLSKMLKFGFIAVGILLVIISGYDAIRDFVKDTAFYNDHINLFGRIKVTPLAMFFAALLGFAASLIMVPAQTLLQERTTPDIRGRVFGNLNLFIGLASTIPAVIAGFLADILTVNQVILAMGIVTVIAGVGGSFRRLIPARFLAKK